MSDEHASPAGANEETTPANGFLIFLAAFLLIAPLIVLVSAVTYSLLNAEPHGAMHTPH